MTVNIVKNEPAGPLAGVRMNVFRDSDAIP
jgi:hypothetical protein